MTSFEEKFLGLKDHITFNPGLQRIITKHCYDRKRVKEAIDKRIRKCEEILKKIKESNEWDYDVQVKNQIKIRVYKELKKELKKL